MKSYPQGLAWDALTSEQQDDLSYLSPGTDLSGNPVYYNEKIWNKDIGLVSCQACSVAGTSMDPAVWLVEAIILHRVGGWASEMWRAANVTKLSQGSLQVIGDATNYSASEMRAAEYVSKLGNDVVLRPASNIARTSDLLVNGMAYDVYTPRTTNIDRIISALAHKNSQAQGLVIDLGQTTVRPSDLSNALARVQGAGATNISDIIILPR